MKQETQQQAGSVEGKRKVFGKNAKKGSRIKSGDAKKYDTMAVTPMGVASDSENEIEEIQPTATLSMQNVEDFYNDKSSFFV